MQIKAVYRKLFRAGSSAAVTIPGEFARVLGLRVGDKCTVYFSNGAVCIRPLRPGKSETRSIVELDVPRRKQILKYKPAINLRKGL